MIKAAYYILAMPLGLAVAVMGFWSITGLIAWLFFGVASGFHGFWTAGVIALASWVTMVAFAAVMQSLSRRAARFSVRHMPQLRDQPFIEDHWG